MVEWSGALRFPIDEPCDDSCTFWDRLICSNAMFLLDLLIEITTRQDEGAHNFLKGAQHVSFFKFHCMEVEFTGGARYLESA